MTEDDIDFIVFICSLIPFTTAILFGYLFESIMGFFLGAFIGVFLTPIVFGILISRIER